MWCKMLPILTIQKNLLSTRACHQPTFISHTDEIHRKSLWKRDGIKKNNEYELDEERMRKKSAESARVSQLILREFDEARKA